MTITTYLTAEELKIKEWEREGLIATLEHIKALDLVEDPVMRTGEIHDSLTYFCMAVPISEFNCGTALCIGGFVKLHSIKGKLTDLITLDETEAEEIMKYVIQYNKRQGQGQEPLPPLGNLYYPFSIDSPWEEITTTQAVCAIHTYLTTGQPDWSLTSPGALS